MAINDIRNQRLFDPVNLLLAVPYLENGINYVSNNLSVNPRDAGGNIVLQEGSESNPLLIIEPVNKLVNTRSFLKVYKTNFEYYSFPITVTNTDQPDLEIDIDIQPVDTVSTRYTLPISEYPAGTGIPDYLGRLNLGVDNVWYRRGEGTETENLVPGGYLRLPFVGGQQIEKGTFTFTPSILDTLKQTNRTVKFTINLLLSAYNSDVNTEYYMRLTRTEPWRNWKNINLQTQSDGQYNAEDYPVLALEYIVDISTINEYDKFSVEAYANLEAFYNSEYSYWDIDVIDYNPIEINNSINGVVDISPKTDLRIGNSSNPNVGTLLINGKQQ